MTHVSPVAQRLRITFGKSGPLKYTSSLDVAKIWERVLRRAGLPILYTRGFNTRPRIQLAMPLPLGITSDCEILDIALRKTIDLQTEVLAQDLLQVAPAGLSIHRIQDIDLRESTMQSRITSAEYLVSFLDAVNPGLLDQRIDDLLERKTIVVERIRKRKRSVMDLRPLIIDLRVDRNSNLIAHLSVGDRGNLRPDQLIEQMGLSEYHHTVHRFNLHMLPD
ncbi:MAG: TIGR03936 family radical SAM-associated protein [Chloroflexi bacterium]|nr:TIGR03936 family radical SAM-associated protein [Chloroflexota bacterium]